MKIHTKRKWSCSCC